MSRPLIRTCPAVTGTSRVTHRPSVVLPLPDSPTSPSTSPGPTARLTPSTARTGPKCLTRSTTSSTGVIRRPAAAGGGPRLRGCGGRCAATADASSAPGARPGPAPASARCVRHTVVGGAAAVGERARVRRGRAASAPGRGSRAARRRRAGPGWAPRRAARGCTGGSGGRTAPPRRASSMVRPAYMTTTRSAMSATTPRSCVMSRTAVPISARRLRSTSRMPAWMVTSSAVVGSSATSSRGRQATAIAIITRCRMPPESWCGYSPHPPRRQRDADELEQLDARRRAAARRACRWCRRSTSPICRPTVSTGLSEVIGSWKTYAMSRPRTSRSARLGEAEQRACRRRSTAPVTVALRRQQPGQRHRGDALAAAGLADQREHLPLGHVERRARRPRAPARPRCGTDGQVRAPTAAPARHRRLSLGSSASRMPSPSRLSASVSSTIATPGNTAIHGPSRNSGWALASMTPSDGVGGPHAEAEERQHRLADDRGRDRDGRLHDQRVDRVGQDVPARAPRTSPAPSGDGRGDVVHAAQAQRLAAGHPDHGRDLRDRRSPRWPSPSDGPDDRGEPDREDQEREGQHRVGEPGHQRVEQAVEAGEQAQRHADRPATAPPTSAPTATEARSPNRTRENWSRPSSSVPNQCAPDGGCSGAPKSVCVGRVRRDERRPAAPQPTAQRPRPTSPPTAAGCAAGGARSRRRVPGAGVDGASASTVGSSQRRHRTAPPTRIRGSITE